MDEKSKSEYAINMNLCKMMVLQQDKLDDPRINEYFDNSSPCHIYFVCRRPRITLVNSKTSINKEKISLTFRIHKKENIEEKTMLFDNTDRSEKVKIKSEYPHTYFQYYNEKGEITTNANVSLFLQKFPRSFTSGDFLNLEILYIGQSFGKKGERKAIDRLKKHETLQAIYAESIIRNPDDDIWIALCYFEEIGFVAIDGRQTQTIEERNEDFKRLSNFMFKLANGFLNQKQKINFTEAALIKYFEPPYNKDFKDSFPSITHSSYEECYTLDVNSVMIELSTLEIVNCNFYSKRIPERDIHLNSFWFHNSEERRSLFQLDFNGTLNNPLQTI
jgi:hypothetical protein